MEPPTPVTPTAGDTEGCTLITPPIADNSQLQNHLHRPWLSDSMLPPNNSTFVLYNVGFGLGVRLQSIFLTEAHHALYYICIHHAHDNIGSRGKDLGCVSLSGQHSESNRAYHYTRKFSLNHFLILC